VGSGPSVFGQQSGRKQPADTWGHSHALSSPPPSSSAVSTAVALTSAPASASALLAAGAAAPATAAVSRGGSANGLQGRAPRHSSHARQALAGAPAAAPLRTGMGHLVWAPPPRSRPRGEARRRQRPWMPAPRRARAGARVPAAGGSGTPARQRARGERVRRWARGSTHAHERARAEATVPSAATPPCRTRAPVTVPQGARPDPPPTPALPSPS